MITVEMMTWACWGFAGVGIGIVAGLNLREHLDDLRSRKIEVPKWDFAPERDDNIRILGPDDSEDE
jgi:hypothetical protein